MPITNFEICSLPERGTIGLGLCCINNLLRNQKLPIYCNRTCVRRTFTVEKAKALALLNVKDIIPLIEWNEKNNIHHLRLSSDMFPHFTDAETEPYTMDFAKEELRKAGEVAALHNHRITMHPGQYNQVGAIRQNVFDHTVDDLSMHADILDHMNVNDNGILCVHGGGLYGLGKEAAVRRWTEQFDDLPRKVKNRLAIENCEKCYSVRDCLEIAQACKIPMIYDNHHYDCYSILHPEETQEPITEMLGEVVETWGSKTPLMHLSSQAPGKKIGGHSDYVNAIPQHMLDVPDFYGCKLDIELEAKAKEDAILHLHKEYPGLF